MHCLAGCCMNIDFLRRKDSPTLELFFAGWGMDSRPFAWAAESPQVADCDFAVCYDYTSLALDGVDWRRYREVRVRAWSLGVYAASLVLPGLSCAVSTAVAINGTLRPVDDEFGIPVAVYEATIEQFSAESLDRFNRRMCGAHKAVFEARRPLRGVGSLLDELRSIRACAVEGARPQFTAWTRAVLGKKDKIFPVANQRRAWAETPVAQAVLELDEPHYMPDIPFVTG